MQHHQALAMELRLYHEVGGWLAVAQHVEHLMRTVKSDGWTYSPYMKCWLNTEFVGRIFGPAPEGGYTVSRDGEWIKGTFLTFEEAKKAFENEP